jgi:hypothetical protein
MNESPFSLVFLKSVDPTKLDWKNPVGIALMLAQRIEEIPGIKGEQKLDILKRALSQLAKTAGVQSAEFEMFIENVLPSVVQSAVLVSKGEFSLKKIDVACCMTSCLAFLQTAKSLQSKSEEK